MTPSQWQWYRDNIHEDDKEQVEQTRNYLEYLAMFWNSEAVEQIRQKRKTEEEVGDSKLSDLDFIKQVEKTFGEELNIKQSEQSLRAKQGALLEMKWKEEQKKKKEGNTEIVKKKKKKGISALKPIVKKERGIKK